MRITKITMDKLQQCEKCKSWFDQNYEPHHKLCHKCWDKDKEENLNG